MKNTIEIYVRGPVASGKTTISQEIVDALRNLGFDVKWDVSPDYDTESSARKEGDAKFKRRMAIIDKTIISVKEIITVKEPQINTV